MKCSDAIRNIDAIFDRDFSDTDIDALRDHFLRCSSCRAELEAMEALLSTAASLDSKIKPPRDLWPGINNRIDSGKTVRFPGNRRWLMASAAAVLIGLALTVGYELGLRREPTTVAEVKPNTVAVQTVSADPWDAVPSSIQEARTELITALEARRNSLNPNTVAVVEENLAIIDRAIAEINTALTGSPNNPGLQKQLHFACMQEINLLQRATRLPAEL